ncbi:hypothetical protein ACJX0J_039682, partial [Zea mays]
SCFRLSVPALNWKTSTTEIRIGEDGIWDSLSVVKLLSGLVFYFEILGSTQLLIILWAFHSDASGFK